MRKGRARIHPATICLCLFLGLAACSEISYTVNQQPNIAKLENELKVGVSTEQDVVAALGQPSGKGRIFVPIAPEPRDVLSYYFEKGNVTASKSMTVERSLVYVWFDHGVYEGYMWTTSPLVGFAN